jgi:hypothetical protein
LQQSQLGQSGVGESISDPCNIALGRPCSRYFVTLWETNSNRFNQNSRNV